MHLPRYGSSPLTKVELSKELLFGFHFKILLLPNLAHLTMFILAFLKDFSYRICFFWLDLTYNARLCLSDIDH